MNKIENILNYPIQDDNGFYIGKIAKRPSIKVILPNIVKNIKKDTIVTDSK